MFCWKEGKSRLKANFFTENFSLGWNKQKARVESKWSFLEGEVTGEQYALGLPTHRTLYSGNHRFDETARTGITVPMSVMSAQPSRKKKNSRRLKFQISNVLGKPRRNVTLKCPTDRDHYHNDTNFRLVLAFLLNKFGSNFSIAKVQNKKLIFL